MTPTTMGIVWLALKMGVAGSFSTALIFAINWFNNYDFKTKGNGGASDDGEGSSLRKKLAERG